MAGSHGSPAAQSGADDQTAGRLEKEILDLQQVIEQAIREDGYKKHPFYPAALVICAIFTVASLAAFIAYDVVIWAVFTFVGIFVSIASAAAVRLQNKEYKEQSARLEEMIQPYR
ncbi:MAG: hypothetical protein AAGU05_16200, partial [Anaerolineaceae bacterium]